MRSHTQVFPASTAPAKTIMAITFIKPEATSRAISTQQQSQRSSLSLGGSVHHQAKSPLASSRRTAPNGPQRPRPAPAGPGRTARYSRRNPAATADP
jgi:hypothetical protein